MLEDSKTYGLINMDNKTCVVGLLSGKKVILLAEKDSLVPGKTKHGGQSSKRYQSVRKEIIKQWRRVVAELCDIHFSNKELTGVIVGGAGPAKEAFVKSLEYNIIKMVDTGHSGIVALEEIVDNAGDAIKNEELLFEKKVINEFLVLLAKEDSKAVYGFAEVLAAHKQRLLDKTIICDFVSKDKIDQFNGDVLIVSSDTKEGGALKGLGGFAGIKHFGQTLITK